MVVVDFSYTTEGLKVSFTNLSEGIPEGYRYLWDFGDNKGTSNDEDPIYEYNNSNRYKVKLSILDISGQVVAQKRDFVIVSDKVKTHLSGSIYMLIDTYIPRGIFGIINFSTKRQFIEKWQLYLQPLVNHNIPIEEYNNELYYEALENQLIMELAAYDFMVVKVTNVINSTAETTIENNSIPDDELSSEVCKSLGGSGETSNSSTSSSVSRAGDIKKIQTGPTEVEYFDSRQMDSEYISNITKAMQPGGIIDIIHKNICMLAERLDIYLPICRSVSKRIVPKVVNNRVQGPLSGPDPFFVVEK